MTCIKEMACIKYQIGQETYWEGWSACGSRGLEGVWEGPLLVPLLRGRGDDDGGGTAFSSAKGRDSSEVQGKLAHVLECSASARV